MLLTRNPHVSSHPISRKTVWKNLAISLTLSYRGKGIFPNKLISFVAFRVFGTL
jgi:hypothetical protein